MRIGTWVWESGSEVGEGVGALFVQVFTKTKSWKATEMV